MVQSELLHSEYLYTVIIYSRGVSCEICFPSEMAKNSMFVRLGTDYEIRNGGYFESIKNSANQFISKP